MLADDYIRNLRKECQCMDLSLEKFSEDYQYCNTEPCFLKQGYIFTDGSCLDIGDKDHRIISIQEWIDNQMVTVGVYDDNICLRIHGGVTIMQMESVMHLPDRKYYYIDVEKNSMRHYTLYDKDEVYKVMNKNYKGV